MGRCTPVECFFCDLCYGHSTKATNRFKDMGCERVLASWCPQVLKNKNLMQLQPVILELVLNSLS
ncbi:hypothetical protein DY000_02046354 [Brassica cretica]|uniref:CTCHY-type domain-containing protein n=1 Tax=Brassica cretica TaxID=69181 RepID=A0ABQ7F8K8_BRACR|nr:hypothetical protein DY000_02046354 [Brassica cretica]